MSFGRIAFSSPLNNKQKAEFGSGPSWTKLLIQLNPTSPNRHIHLVQQQNALKKRACQTNRALGSCSRNWYGLSEMSWAFSNPDSIGSRQELPSARGCRHARQWLRRPPWDMDREAGHEHFEYFPPFNLEPGLCLRVRTKCSCASGDSPVVPSSYRITRG